MTTLAAAYHPALAAWRTELAAGKRTTRTADDLWRAAGWEAAAHEADRDGSHDRASHCRRRAEEIVAAAALSLPAAPPPCGVVRPTGRRRLQWDGVTIR